MKKILSVKSRFSGRFLLWQEILVGAFSRGCLFRFLFAYVYFYSLLFANILKMNTSVSSLSSSSSSPPSSSSSPVDNTTENETSIVGGAFRNIFRTFVRVFRFEKVALGSLPRRVPTRVIAKSADTLGQVERVDCHVMHCTSLYCACVQRVCMWV